MKLVAGLPSEANWILVRRHAVSLGDGRLGMLLGDDGITWLDQRVNAGDHAQGRGLECRLHIVGAL